MPKQITYISAAYTDDATFRAWGASVNAAIAASGLVQTADTGQINWASATKPTTTQVLIGSEIWRFDDSLQGSNPIFIEFIYRSAGHTSGNNYRISIRVGTGSNGSGTLTGSGSATIYSMGSTSSTAASDNTFVQVHTCHTEGSFTWLMSGSTAPTSAINTYSLNISRTLDSSGIITGDGLYLFAGSGTTSVPAAYAVWVNLGTGTVYGSSTTQPNTMHPLDLTTWGLGNAYYVFPHYACIPQPLVACGMVNCFYPAANSGLPDYTEFEVSLNGGTPRNYLQVWALSAALGSPRHNTTNMLSAAQTLVTYETLSVGTCYLWED